MRHGESVWNAQGKIQGHQDPDLSPRGVEESKLAAARLRDARLRAICTSDLRRACHTAQIIAQACGLAEQIVTSPALREACLGEWEGKTAAQVQNEYPELLQRWMTDSAGNRPPGGESLEALSQRVVPYIVSTMKASPGGAIAFVTHGGPAKAVVSHVLGAGVASFVRMRTDNCAITTVRYDAPGDRLILIGFNDTSHLAPRTESEPRSSFEAAADI